MIERLTGVGDLAARQQFAAAFAPSGKLTIREEIAKVAGELLLASPE